MEGMTAISIDEAQTLLQSHDLLGIGARADQERRRRHGTRTTFVRVLELHVDAIPAALPTSFSAGEIRLVGKPESIEDASAKIAQARALAASYPLTAFSLDDLEALAQGSPHRVRDLFSALKSGGLETIADAPVDALHDPIATLRAAREAGLAVPRVTVRHLAGGQVIRLVQRAREMQAAAGGIRAFAPLPRVTSPSQPSTGYEDVKTVAVARLLCDTIESIQVDWALYGPKLAQVALTIGADDVDAVSPFEGHLGRRRSPLEEIRGNITAAGQEPIERDGCFTEVLRF
jgi:aminodeoxyfutalosine synthase